MSEDMENGWGSSASGRSGDISIHVNSQFLEGSSSDSELWELEFELPNFYLRFAIRSPNLVSDLLAFLQRHMNQAEFHEVELGKLGDSEVWLLKCSECAGHFIFLVASNTGAVRFNIFSNEASEFVAALAEAVNDLI